MTRLPAIAAAFLIGAVVGAVIMGHWQPVGRFMVVRGPTDATALQVDTGTGQGWVIHWTEGKNGLLEPHRIKIATLPSLLE